MTLPQTTLGNPLMDNDHARLEALMAEAAVVADGELAARLRDVEAETRAHFAREEEMMRAAQLPILHCHIAQHAMLLGAFDEGRAAAAADDMPALRRFLGEILPQLIAAHVDSVDRVSASFLAAEMSADDFAHFRLPNPA